MPYLPPSRHRHDRIRSRAPPLGDLTYCRAAPGLGELWPGRSPRPELAQAGRYHPGTGLVGVFPRVGAAIHKGRMPKFGRAPDDIKILPGVFPVVGRSVAEAEDKFDALQRLIEPVVGLGLLRNLAGPIDLSQFPLDGPLPDLPETNGGKSRQHLLVELARRENLSIRQLYLRVAGARGHWQLVGTASQIADQLEERFLAYGADGFNIMAPTLPGGLADFVELVVPELRRRGLFRSEYAGSTLREHLGLPYKSNHFSAAAAAAE